MPDIPEPNTIDLLMSLDPLEMTSLEIDAIIAYHRKNRANFEAGVSAPKAKRDTGPKVKLDLASLGIGPAPAAPMKRRF